MLVNGEWKPNARDLTNEDGEFDRQLSAFRDRIGDGSDAAFSPDSGRYHLYVSDACPWAHRTLLVRTLKGLEDAISVDVVDPVRRNDGWEFAPEKDGCTADSIHGESYLRDIYRTADPTYTGRPTVPVLWDRERETIVNNESREIMRDLDVRFDEFASRDVDLYPEGHRAEVDRLIDDLYEPVNNGVYRAGFADTQDAHERAVKELFEALDRWDDHLSKNRYLAGDVLTEADLCLFTTLIRFDAVYHTHFKCTVRRIVDYPNLWGYVRELYSLPGVSETVRMDHIKTHYYRSHEDLNPKRIVPTGPEIDFTEPHGRDRLAGGPPETLRN